MAAFRSARGRFGPLMAAALCGALLASCGTSTKTEVREKPPSAASPPSDAPAAPAAISPEPHLRPVSWSEVQGWEALDPVPALGAFLKGCGILKSKPEWARSCAAAMAHRGDDPAAVRDLFERNFSPHQISDGEKTTGKLTGYFEPLLRGSRAPSDRYRYPLYNPPGDLVDPKHPDGKLLANANERGRMVDGRLVPYLTRSEIDSIGDLMEPHAFLWVDSIGDRFFLHIQGSGRVALENGTVVRVGYANHNGHRFVSLANHLIRSGELPRSEASMEGIKAFLALNEGRAKEILAVNPRYIFFRELPPSKDGPIGALGAPLTALHSVAVDRRFVPLGAPMVIATEGYDEDHTFTRLVVAQDVGGAIKGKVRADYFWGYGHRAGRRAESTNQPFSAWVLLPRG